MNAYLLRTLVIACLTLTMVGQPVLAQNSPNSQSTSKPTQTSDCVPFPPGINSLALLRLPQVQTELQITKLQVAELTKLESILKQKFTGLYTSLQSRPWTDERKKKFFEEVQQVSQENSGQLNEILQPRQFTRLKEIMLQVYGWQSLNQEETVSLLNLSEDQQNQLRKISQETNQKAFKMFEFPATNSPQSCNKVMTSNKKRLDQLRQKSQKQADAILSQKQQQLLKILKGKPFTIDLTLIN
ncbi:hypothetical protein H6F32_11745 [Anabaena sp. FACHB-1237]|nr:hypothetical protein [Anabaena sp. FACHB-1237]